MSTARVIKGNSFKEFQFDGKTLLSNFTREISLPMPCSGNHTCGKCKVKAEGELSPLSETEKKLLSEDEINGGIRLACCCFALGDCTVTAGDKSGGRVLLEGESKKINHKGFGIAADIGTTTVAVYLYKDGKEISALGEMNRQAPYGGDVISRIGANEPDKLCEIIRNQLQNMFLSAIGGKAAPGEIERIVITGNTAMLHFLRGYNPSSLAVSPFKCVSLFGETIKGEELFPFLKTPGFIFRRAYRPMWAPIRFAPLPSPEWRKRTKPRFYAI